MQTPKCHIMARALLRLLALVLACWLPCIEGALAAVSPVEKVLAMLMEMQKKGARQMDIEKKFYAEYKEAVQSTGADLAFDIKTAKDEVQELQAFIADADNKVDVLSREIASLEGDISDKETAKSETLAERDQQRTQNLGEQVDLEESVDALERAIQTLEAKSMDAGQAEVLLQEMAMRRPQMDLALDGLVQLKEHAASLSDQTADLQFGHSKDLDESNDFNLTNFTTNEVQTVEPHPAAYKFQSSDIVDMLEKLQEQFKEKLSELVTTESNQAHNAALEIQHLTDAIAAMSSSVSTKTATKGEVASNSAAAKGKLSTTTEELKQDELTLRDMKATFTTKTVAFNENQRVRLAELEALAKAIEIMGGQTVAESYEKHVGFAQRVSFLQVRSAQSRVKARGRAAAFLQRRATALASKTLSALAAKMTANPFAKVITMMEELLEKMKESATAEADHKAWCDEQLGKNKLKRNKKQTHSDQLQAKIETTANSIERQTKEIQQLMAEQTQLTKDIQKMTEQRTAEKEANIVAMQDAAAGKDAVQQAIGILSEFYGEKTALVQQPAAPELAAYRGMQGKKGGVIGMLQIIQSDFARLFTETELSERQAALEYEKDMDDATKSKASKHKAAELLKLSTDQAEFEKSEDTKDLKFVQKDLQKANEYYEDLKPTCITIHVNYEERARKREEELAALKEAYDILDSKSL